MSQLAVVWLVVAVVFAIAEGLTTQLVSIWFTIGALAATVTAQLGGQLWLQFAVFAAVAAVCLALTRPLAKRMLRGKTTQTNADSAIGQTVAVISDIGVGEVGQVKVNGQMWSAVSRADYVIRAGDLVNIQEIEGVKLVVEKVPHEHAGDTINKQSVQV